MILDGGLATELERRGHCLNDTLWSARLLLTNPGEIGAVHRAYLDAGADCITTASYQASIPGLVAEGLSETHASQLIADSVAIACDARDAFVAGDKGDAFLENTSAGLPRLRPLVAASAGPYGAYLADGSEYRGDYSVTRDDLQSFHEPRLQILAESDADLIACETIPNFLEFQVLVQLLNATPGVCAWLSVSCRDSTTLRDGTPFVECVELARDCEAVVAVGVNCTSPRYVGQLVEQAYRIAPAKAIVAYPNSGETYDPAARRWVGTADPGDFAAASEKWYNAGATLVGGCCRTGPSHISDIRKQLIRNS